jgi:hypothetical protein
MLKYKLTIYNNNQTVFQDTFYNLRDIGDSDRKSVSEMNKIVKEYEEKPEHYVVSIAEND